MERQRRSRDPFHVSRIHEASLASGYEREISAAGRTQQNAPPHHPVRFSSYPHLFFGHKCAEGDDDVLFHFLSLSPTLFLRSLSLPQLGLEPRTRRRDVKERCTHAAREGGKEREIERRGVGDQVSSVKKKKGAIVREHLTVG